MAKKKNTKITLQNVGIPLKFFMNMCDYRFNDYVNELTLAQLIKFFQQEKDADVKSKFFNKVLSKPSFKKDNALDLYKQPWLGETFRKKLRLFLVKKEFLSVDVLLFDHRSYKDWNSRGARELQSDISEILDEKPFKEILKLYEEAVHQNDRIALLPILFSCERTPKGSLPKLYMSLDEVLRDYSIEDFLTNSSGDIPLMFEIYEWETSEVLREKMYNFLTDSMSSRNKLRELILAKVGHFK